MKRLTLLLFLIVNIFLSHNIIAQDSIPQIAIRKDSINTIEIAHKITTDFEKKTVAWMKSITVTDTVVSEIMLDSMITKEGNTYKYKGFKANAVYHKPTGKKQYLNLDYVMFITQNKSSITITFDVPQFYTTEMTPWKFTYGYFFDPLKGGVKPPYKDTVPGLNQFLNELVKEYLEAL